MFIALGLIGALWVVGMFIVPDKNAPPQSAIPAATATQVGQSSDSPATTAKP